MKLPHELPEEVRQQITEAAKPTSFSITCEIDGGTVVPGMLIATHKYEAVGWTTNKRLHITTALIATFTCYGTALALEATLYDNTADPTVATALIDTRDLDTPPASLLLTCNKMAVALADLDGTCYAVCVSDWSPESQEEAGRLIAQAKFHDRNCRRADRYDLESAQSLYEQRSRAMREE